MLPTPWQATALGSDAISPLEQEKQMVGVAEVHGSVESVLKMWDTLQPDRPEVRAVSRQLTYRNLIFRSSTGHDFFRGFGILLLSPCRVKHDRERAGNR